MFQISYLFSVTYHRLTPKLQDQPLSAVRCLFYIFAAKLHTWTGNIVGTDSRKLYLATNLMGIEIKRDHSDDYTSPKNIYTALLRTKNNYSQGTSLET